jgi:polyferredoxin
MYLAKQGRKDYLDFLRNITPQALLVFIGAVYIHGGLHGQTTFETLVVGLVFWTMAAFAAWCSISLFFDSLKEGHVKSERERAKLAYPEIDGNRAMRLKQSLKRFWHLRRLLAELVVVMLIIEAVCIVAAVSGGFSAVSALRLS